MNIEDRNTQICKHLIALYKIKKELEQEYEREIEEFSIILTYETKKISLHFSNEEIEK